MRGIRRMVTLICLGMAAPACAAILGDDFRVGDEDDEGDGDSGSDGAGADPTAASTGGGECTEQACIQCSQQHCSPALVACDNAGCLPWLDCYDGYGSEECLEDCDACYQGAFQAYEQLIGCMCAACTCCVTDC